MSPHEPIDGDGRIGDQQPADLTAGLGIFRMDGGMVNHPAGGGGGKGPVEDVAGLVARGYGYVAFNAFDGEVADDDWPVWRREADDEQLPWGWWARCYTNTQVTQLAHLTERDRRRFVIFNLETELNTGKVSWEHALAHSVELIRRGVDVAWSVEGAVYQHLGSTPGKQAWAEITDHGVVVTPQAFQAVNDDYEPAECVEYAHHWGCELVVPTVGAFAVPPKPKPVRADYAWDGPIILYLVDNVDRWSDW